MATTLTTPLTTMTGAQFDALPYDEGRQWELLDGELIAMPSPTFRHQEIVSCLLVALRSHLSSVPAAGRAVPDVEFALTERDRVRPDVFVLLGANATNLDLDRVPISGAPDIAIEVISPSERTAESQKKVRQYLRCGTREVWQIYPTTQTAELHTREATRIIEVIGEITSSLLPGLSIPLASLFE